MKTLMNIMNFKTSLIESILSDMDDVLASGDKMYTHPFKAFFKVNSHNNNIDDWNSNVSLFNDIIASNAKEDKTNLNDWYGLADKIRIKKGEVYIWICENPISGYGKRILLFFSDEDTEAMKQVDLMPKNRGKNCITLMNSTNRQNKTIISITSGLPAKDKILYRYKLNKKYSKEAIDMINKLVDGNWRKSWENL